MAAGMKASAEPVARQAAPRPQRLAVVASLAQSTLRRTSTVRVVPLLPKTQEAAGAQTVPLTTRAAHRRLHRHKSLHAELKLKQELGVLAKVVVLAGNIRGPSKNTMSVRILTEGLPR